MGIVIDVSPLGAGFGPGLQQAGNTALASREMGLREQQYQDQQSMGKVSQAALDLEGMTPQQFAGAANSNVQGPQLPNAAPPGSDDQAAFDAMHQAKIARAQQVMSDPKMSAQGREYMLQVLHQSMAGDVMKRDTAALRNQVHRLAASPIMGLPMGNGETAPDPAATQQLQQWEDELQQPSLDPRRVDQLRGEISQFIETRSKAIAYRAQHDATVQRYGAMIEESAKAGVNTAYARQLLGQYSASDPKVGDEIMEQYMPYALRGQVPVQVGTGKPIFVDQSSAPDVQQLYMDKVKAQSDLNEARAKYNRERPSALDVIRERGAQQQELEGVKQERQAAIENQREGGRTVLEQMREKAKTASQEKQNRAAVKIAEIRGKQRAAEAESARNLDVAKQAALQAQQDPRFQKAETPAEKDAIQAEYADRIKRGAGVGGVSPVKARPATDLINAIKGNALQPNQIRMMMQANGWKSMAEVEAAAKAEGGL